MSTREGSEEDGPVRTSDEEKRAKSRFILLYGILAWGVPVYLCTVIFTLDERGRVSVADLSTLDPVWELARGLIMIPLMGYLFGALMWKRRSTGSE